MFKKALEFLAPSIVGLTIGFIAIALSLGVQTVRAVIIPALCSTCCSLMFSLCLDDEDDEDDEGDNDEDE